MLLYKGFRTFFFSVGADLIEEDGGGKKKVDASEKHIEMSVIALSCVVCWLLTVAHKDKSTPYDNSRLKTKSFF